MLHILIVCEFPALNGGEFSMLSTIPFLKAEGFKFTIAAPVGGPLTEYLQKKDIGHLPLEFYNKENIRYKESELHDQLKNLIQCSRPDIIHANSLAVSRVFGPVVKELGLPAIAHLRDIIKLSGRAAKNINAYSRILAVSQATKDHHVAQGLESDRVVVQNNGVDLTRFFPKKTTLFLHKELGLPLSAKLVGAVGQISYRKDFLSLLHAAPEILRLSPEAHFLIVGERHADKQLIIDYEQKLLRLAKAPPLSGHVHFLGRRNDIPELLQELSLLIHPARQEPLGRVLLEAACCGIPVVATAVGGTEEIFYYKEETPWIDLVEPDSPETLAASAGRVLSFEGGISQEERLLLHEKMAQKFNIVVISQQMKEHYLEVVRIQRPS
ncbi:MAG: glycosyltransferase family 4 protein [Pirellulaceae bacterium]|nr:glycosyltransferase family 4 protein [Pirellulaceae bacterium]